MSMTPLQAKRLGALLATARKRKGLSYRALATQLGVALGWLAELEMGGFLDPSPDRLTRLAEALDIEPSRIDRITKGSMADSLPEVRTYFRAKYRLTPDEIKQIERYVGRFIDPPEERAA